MNDRRRKSKIRRKIKRNRVVKNKVMESIQKTWMVEMNDFINNPIPTIQEEIIALKQKNEELKWQLNEVIEDNDYYQKENAELSNSVTELKKENEELKNYIHKCWHEEELNDYSNYITNTDSEFRELVNRLRIGS